MYVALKFIEKAEPELDWRAEKHTCAEDSPLGVQSPPEEGEMKRAREREREKRKPETGREKDCVERRLSAARK